MPTTTLDLPIAELSPNTGQVPGLAKNPRFCKDDRFALLVKSIQDDPEMLHLREAIVYPHKGQYVIIAGNMRYRACKELKYVRMPCKVLDEATPVEKLQAYVVKDNANFGNLDLDVLANEWSDLPLADWGVDLPADWLAEPGDIGVVDGFNEGVNFIVKCENLDELAIVQQRLKVATGKVTAKRFLETINGVL